MQAASQMGAAMADLERSKPSKAGGFFLGIIQWQFRPFIQLKASQGAALLRKRWVTLRRNRRAMCGNTDQW